MDREVFKLTRLMDKLIESGGQRSEEVIQNEIAGDDTLVCFNTNEALA